MGAPRTHGDRTLNWRISQGKRAQRGGEQFENEFRSACARSGVHALRFPNGCKTVRAPKGIKLIRVPTPFDWILSFSRTSGYIDTKTTAEKGFPHAKIEDHQVVEMLALEREGHRSGYVVHFTSLPAGPIVFFTATILFALKPRTSLKVEDGVILGREYSFDPRLIFTGSGILPVPAR